MTATSPSPAESPVVPPFSVISGAQVQQALQGREKQIVDLVEATYRLARRRRLGQPAVLLPALPGPPVRPDHRPARLDRRAGAGRRHQVDLQLPGERGGRHPPRLGGADPQRPRHRLPVRRAWRARSSAPPGPRRPRRWPPTGSARGRPRPTRVGFFGTGLIARYIHTFLAGTGWTFDEIGVFDLSARQRRRLPRLPATTPAPAGRSPCTTAPRR